MRQTLAIFLDAYRELNSKKLFWIVLALSVAVVGAFSMVGLNEKGLSILWWSFPSPFNSLMFSQELFYKLMFANLGVKVWLSILSTILALVSTAGIFPDLISSGSIELTLCKPIGRLRLFLTKYLAGLTFTAIQVSLFTLAVFLVFGLRAGSWLPGLFWTVPIMVAFFSFLYCVCVLLGLLTRSTVAALLVTLLLWFVVFGLHTTEQTLLLFRTRNEMQQEKLEHRLATYRAQAKEAAENPEKEKPSVSKFLRSSPEQRAESTQKALDSVRADAPALRTWHNGFYGLKTVLPKTTETIDLLERVLVSQADMNQLRKGDDEAVDMGDEPEERRINMQQAAQRVQDKVRDRPLWWVLGTSFGFEAVILGIAAWIFCRRDF